MTIMAAVMCLVAYKKAAMLVKKMPNFVLILMIFSSFFDSNITWFILPYKNNEQR